MLYNRHNSKIRKLFIDQVGKVVIGFYISDSPNPSPQNKRFSDLIPLLGQVTHNRIKAQLFAPEYLDIPPIGQTPTFTGQKKYGGYCSCPYGGVGYKLGSDLSNCGDLKCQGGGIFSDCVFREDAGWGDIATATCQ